MSHSTPGLPVHHQLPESTQTHVHWVSDAIQPSHPLLSPSPPALNLSQHQGLFKWVSSSHQVAKVLEFQWIRAWANSGRQWRAGKPGVLVHGLTKNPPQLSDWTPPRCVAADRMQREEHSITFVIFLPKFLTLTLIFYKRGWMVKSKLRNIPQNNHPIIFKRSRS